MPNKTRTIVMLFLFLFTLESKAFFGLNQNKEAIEFLEKNVNKVNQGMSLHGALKNESCSYVIFKDSNGELYLTVDSVIGFVPREAALAFHMFNLNPNFKRMKLNIQLTSQGKSQYKWRKRERIPDSYKVGPQLTAFTGKIKVLELVSENLSNEASGLGRSSLHVNPSTLIKYDGEMIFPSCESM